MVAVVQVKKYRELRKRYSAEDEQLPQPVPAAAEGQVER